MHSWMRMRSTDFGDPPECANHFSHPVKYPLDGFNLDRWASQTRSLIIIGGPDISQCFHNLKFVVQSEMSQQLLIHCHEIWHRLIRFNSFASHLRFYPAHHQVKILLHYHQPLPTISCSSTIHPFHSACWYLSRQTCCPITVYSPSLHQQVRHKTNSRFTSEYIFKVCNCVKHIREQTDQVKSHKWNHESESVSRSVFFYEVPNLTFTISIWHCDTDVVK